jgi:purine-binding chemotaxis protein CheW
MTFELDELPEYCRPYVTRGRGGYGFNQAIKDSIVFEYHDIQHDSPLPDLDIILVRDVLSFMQETEQKRLLNGFKEKLKGRGVIILGRNETITGDGWRFVGKEPVSIYGRTE